jgi:predicted acetyltransferase
VNPRPNAKPPTRCVQAGDSAVETTEKRKIMNELELQLPTLEHKVAAENFKSEFSEKQEPVIYGSALFDQMEFEQWLAHNTNNRHESTVNIGWVTATTFFAVKKHDLKIIGMIDIRHNLGNEFLAQYGGHVGYSVRPSERRKGYATEMLRMGIEYAKSLKIEKMMIACFSDNTPSIKTIEKCGAVLTETKPYIGGQLCMNIPHSEEKFVNVYWIEL